jgi:hypothetical protein
MKKNLTMIGLSFIFAGLFVQPAAAATCARASEQQSLAMRALQSDLMVAAISCKQKQSYNHYVNQFSSYLPWYGKNLKSYFYRHYGAGSERHLNRFVTQMANQASQQSLQQSDRAYCKNAQQLFQKVSHSFPWQIVDLAEQKYASWHGVKGCETKQEVAAAR